MPVSVKMSSKHQIVVPREARDALGLVPGDRLVVTVREDGVVEMVKQPADLIGDLEGSLGDLGNGDLWPELGHG